MEKELAFLPVKWSDGEEQQYEEKIKQSLQATKLVCFLCQPAPRTHTQHAAMRHYKEFHMQKSVQVATTKVMPCKRRCIIAKLGNLDQPIQGSREADGLHYHCCSSDCNWATRTAKDLVHHYQVRHTSTEKADGSELERTRRRATQRLQPLSSKVPKKECCYCGLLLHPESLGRHVRSMHQNDGSREKIVTDSRHLASTWIDKARWIVAVRCQRSGVNYFTHAQPCKDGSFGCEMEICRNRMLLQPDTTCEHMQSAQYADVSELEHNLEHQGLNESTLNRMLASNIMSQRNVTECLNRAKLAHEMDTPVCLRFMDSTSNGNTKSSKAYIQLSILAPYVRHYCLSGRLSVTVRLPDADNNDIDIRCHCSQYRAKSGRKVCTERLVALWFIHEHFGNLVFRNEPNEDNGPLGSPEAYMISESALTLQGADPEIQSPFPSDADDHSEDGCDFPIYAGESFESSPPSHLPDHRSTPFAYPPKDISEMKTIFEYISGHKRIPEPSAIPHTVKHKSLESLKAAFQVIRPTEEHCPYCKTSKSEKVSDGHDGVMDDSMPSDRDFDVDSNQTQHEFFGSALTEDLVFHQNGRIIALDGIIKNVTVCIRFCRSPLCGLPVRYSEWNEGILNFNDHTFISVGLFVHMLCDLQNHTAPGRTIRSHAMFLGERINEQELLNAFVSLLPLLDIEENEVCIFCGFFPWFLVADANHKVGFDIDFEKMMNAFTEKERLREIHQTESDSVSSTPSFDAFETDTVRFQKVYHEACFFFQFGHSSDFVPDLFNWGYWLNKNTRAHPSLVINSEREKLRYERSARKKMDALKRTNIEVQPQHTSHEMDSTEMTIQMAVSDVMELLTGSSRAEIQSMCERLNVPSVGSRRDMVKRLKDVVSDGSGNKFVKLFTNFYGRTGCHVDFTCPHMVNYASKVCLRAESVRDYVDIIRSMKFVPTIVCADMAGPIADHAKLRYPEMYGSLNGMWCAEEPEKVNGAKDGTFRIRIPWAKNLRSLNMNDDRGKALSESNMHSAAAHASSLHPVSLTQERKLLYDEFHQGNTTDEMDILRTVALCPDLEGLVKTTVAENFNNVRKRDVYFLNSLTPMKHLMLEEVGRVLRNNRVVSEQRSRYCSNGRWGVNELGVAYKIGELHGNHDIANSDVIPPSARLPPQLDVLLHPQVDMSNSDQQVRQIKMTKKPSSKRKIPKAPSNVDVTERKRKKTVTIQDRAELGQLYAITTEPSLPLDAYDGLQLQDESSQKMSNQRLTIGPIQSPIDALRSQETVYPTPRSLSLDERFSMLQSSRSADQQNL
eukprot:GILK01012664.1.p1 GENE.GILK01012664.1~~GILK01012664.1.p1  ORF type:complete len:1303 (-),score=70.66 GILK01012664.1:212-4090(-)